MVGLSFESQRMSSPRMGGSLQYGRGEENTSRWEAWEKTGDRGDKTSQTWLAGWVRRSDSMISGIGMIHFWGDFSIHNWLMRGEFGHLGTSDCCGWQQGHHGNGITGIQGMVDNDMARRCEICYCLLRLSSLLLLVLFIVITSVIIIIAIIIDRLRSPAKP